MRFRYFDSEGAEVRISSVDALKFRIGTGAVTPVTLLYDAAVGRWAPAWHHQVFRFLVEEEADLLKGAARERWEELADQEPPELGSTPAPSTEAEPPPPAPPSPASSPAEPAPPGRPARSPSAPSDRAPTTEDSGADEPAEGPGPSEPASPPPPVASAPDGDEVAPPGDRLVEPDRAPSPSAGGAGSGRDGQEPAASPTERLRGRVREIDVPTPFARRPEPGAGGPEAGASGPGPVGRPGRRRRWLVLGLLLLVGAGALLAVLGEVERDALAADRTAGSPGAAARVVPGAETTEAPGPARGDAADPAGGSGVGKAGPAEGSAAPPRRDVEELVSGVAGAASGDLARAMDDLQDALGVPERPPAAWLEGTYLADAARFPAVRSYWEAYGAYVASVRAVEGDLYRGFVQNRVLKMRLDTASAADLSARILERYEQSAAERAQVYDDLSALAGTAVEMHDILVDRRDAISYEPFSGRELSRDPVVEAVSDDPELAEIIWSRLDRIFELLERVQGLRPVSTLRLQEALLGGLRLPEQGG